MKTYNVSFPVVIEVCTQVEVEDDQDEDHAIDKAFDGFPGLDISGEKSDYLINDGGPLRHIVKGNICFASPREATAELEKE